MATVYGNTTNHWRAYMDYTVSQTDTTYTIAVTGGMQSVNWGFAISSGIDTKLSCTGKASVSGSGGFSSGTGATTKKALKSTTWSIAKGSSAKTVTIGVETKNSSGYMNGTSTASVNLSIPAITQYAPKAVANLKNVRNSDTKNTLSWTNNTDTTHVYTNLYVERQVDGGSWSQIASLSGSATSYADSAASPNHSYRYRVRPKNSAGYGSYATSDYTYNTPAAPTSVTAVRKAETTVTVAIANPALTAKSLELQRSIDGSTWTTVQTATGLVTSLDDTPGGGTYYYRARNLRDSLASAWSAPSNPVVTICAPAAPTLLAPASGIVVSKSQNTIRFTWKHNPIDGSAQSDARLEFSVNNGEWQPAGTIGAAEYKDVANDFAVNATVAWRVCTKGAHADYGPYSATQSFRVCQVPTVVVTSPAVDGEAITDVPLLVSWSYSDNSGEQQQATVQVRGSDGTTLWSKNIQGKQTSIAIESNELLLPNSSSFVIEVDARSTSGLAASAVRTFATAYEEPAIPGIKLEVDEINAKTFVTGFFGFGEAGTPDTTTLGIFRVNADGRMVCLADKVLNAAGVEDVYPPLDQELTYLVVAYTANGLTSRAEQKVVVPSGGAVFFNFGAEEQFTNIAKIAMDIEWETETTVDSEVVETEGSEDPLVFYGTSKTVEAGVSGNVWWREATVPTGWGGHLEGAAAFERLAADTGVKVVRYPHGPAMAAHVACKVKVAAANPLVANVSIQTRKVRADGLVI